MFTLEGDVLQDALRTNEADIDQSDGQQDGEEDQVLTVTEGATIPEPREPFDAQHRDVEDLSTIRLVSNAIAGSTTTTTLSSFALPNRRTTARKRLPPSLQQVGGDLDATDALTPHSASEDQFVERPTAISSHSLSKAFESRITPSNDIPGLAPPPEFQERFKFMICSSSLLKDRPNFDGNRSMHSDLSTTFKETRRKPEMTLTGLGIQELSVTEGINEPRSNSEGLRRRRPGPREPETERARRPASFRRASSSCASASMPSTPEFSPTSDHATQSGWEYLVYSPLVRALSPYMEPIILLLSSLIWIFEIVGWIWLELFAVSAIALCGFVNIVLTMSMHRRQGRPRSRRRRSRASRQHETLNALDEPRIVGGRNRTDIDATPQHEEDELMAKSQTAPSGKRKPKSEPLNVTTKMKNGEATDSVPPPTRRVDAKEESSEQTSLQGLALETLQAVIQNAEEMDDVIANAFSVIESSDIPTSRLESNVGRPKHLHETLHKLFANLNSQFLETYSSLAPLVSAEELQTLEAMYGVTDDVERSSFLSPHSPSFDIPPPLRSPLVVGRMLNRVSASEYSTTSTSVEGDSSYERQEGTSNGFPSTGTPIKRSRAHSLLSNQSAKSDTAKRPVLSFYGVPEGGQSGTRLDRFSPLPARSPRLAQRQSNTTLRRASSLKEKSSEGTIRIAGRASWTDGSGASDSDAGDGRRLRYSWRYPSTLPEESESAQSLPKADDTIARIDTIVTSPTAEELKSDQDRSIPIPRRSAPQLKELRLSQSGFGSRSQGNTPLIPSSLSPNFGLTRTPEDQQRPDGYFQAVGGPSRATPQRLHRKRSSLQSLRYLNPDGTSVIASSPARHQRNRSSIDVSQRDLDRFIGTLPVAMVNGLRGHGRPEEDDVHNRSSRVSDKTPLPVRPTSSIGYTFSPAYPSSHQPRLQRATSYGHLTLPSLKASFLAVHLKRKRMACALLALDFDAPTDITSDPGHLHQIALAKYWAQIHIILDDLRQSLEAIIAEVKTAIMPDKTTLFEPFLLGRPHDSFAPRQSDQHIMLEQIHILSRLLAGAQNELTELRSAIEQGDNAVIIQQWDQLRLDLAAMIRSWERGRRIAAKSSNTLQGDAADPDEVPDFVKHWDVEDAPVLDDPDVDTSNEASIYSPIPAEPASAVQVTANDDATNHLLDSTSASFLPPPGIEDVFEALLDFPPKRSPLTGPDGQKLSREERIRLVKLARETSPSIRSANGTNHTENPLRPAAPVTMTSGQVMAELKSVIGEMKKRRVTAPTAHD